MVLGASKHSAGRIYRHALDGNKLSNVRNAQRLKECGLVFSGHDSDVAGDTVHMSLRESPLSVLTRNGVPASISASILKGKKSWTGQVRAFSGSDPQSEPPRRFRS